MAGSEFEPEWHHFLLFGDAEFTRALDRVDGIVTAVCYRNDVRLRRLGLQHERRKIGRAERMPDSAQHLAPVLLDKGGGAVLKRAAEHVVRGDEEPGLAELWQRLTDCGANLVGVIDPVDRIVGRAGLAGEIRRTGAGQQHRLVVGFGDLQHCKPYGRIHQIGYRIDAVEVEPAPRDSGTDIGLVLMIGGDDLDRYAVNLVAELLGRHLRGLD